MPRLTSLANITYIALYPAFLAGQTPTANYLINRMSLVSLTVAPYLPLLVRLLCRGFVPTSASSVGSDRSTADSESVCREIIFLCSGCVHCSKCILGARGRRTIVVRKSERGWGEHQPKAAGLILATSSTLCNHPYRQELSMPS
jgi:hypothetical protein